MASSVLTRTTAIVAALLVAACSAAGPFPLREPLKKDADDVPFKGAPEEYVSPFAWDGANQIVFRPVARFFAIDPAGRAANVNAADEVPDSSWFVNRIGVHPMTAEDVVRGPCGEKVLDVDGKDGTWIIDKGKSNGANPGFRVNVPGVGKFMLKVDPDGEPDRATGATAIAARLYHAAGYNAPCDSVVYFRPALLSLKPGLTVTDNSGVTRPFNAAALQNILDHASKRNGLVRMGASRWLPGKTIGPYRYEGTRSDDPNDVVPHEDRRELRGARLLAAWLNHFDSREQNTMDVFLSSNKKDENAPGFVQHYILDMGDCFGSVWKWDVISRRLGHAYYFDVPYVTEDFLTLGIIERPWDRAKQDGGIFNYFSARDFDPELWRGGYPNPAFARMTEADGAWMARILARFTDPLVFAAVDAGQYDEGNTAYLKRVLVLRRDLVLRRYLRRLSPLTDVRLEGDRVCATDLAVRAHVVPAPAAGDQVCATVPHHMEDGGVPDVDEKRYRVVDVRSASAPGPLRVHLYDLGPRRGYRLAGIERPEGGP